MYVLLSLLCFPGNKVDVGWLALNKEQSTTRLLRVHFIYFTRLPIMLVCLILSYVPDLFAVMLLSYVWLSDIKLIYTHHTSSSLFPVTLYILHCYNWLIDWVSACMIDWVSEWVSEWLHDWLSEWVSEWLHDLLIDWLIDWLIEWVREWLHDGWIELIDWVSEWVSEWLH